MSVVKADDPHTEPPRAGALAHAGLLTECRELILDRLCEALSATLEDIDADLQEKRNKAGMNAAAQCYVEAQYYLRAASPNLEQALRRAFERNFRERLTPQSHKSRTYRDLVLDEQAVALVDHGTMAENLTVQRLARWMGRAAEGELKDLQPRIATLLQMPDFEPANDPLGPEVLCETFRDLCWDMGSSLEVRTLMLEQLTKRLAAVLRPVYHELNELLESRQVHQPPRQVRRSRHGGTGARPGGAPAAAAAPAAAPPPEAPLTEAAGAAHPAAGARAGVIQKLLSDGNLRGLDLAALARPAPSAVAGGGAGMPGAAGAPGLPGTGGAGMPGHAGPGPLADGGDGQALPGGLPVAAGAGMPGGFAAAPADGFPVLGEFVPAAAAAPAGASFSSGALLGMLDRLQRGESAALSCPEASFEFRLPADPGANALHPLIESGLGQHLETLDSIILDVVASLFDHIFDDERVPDLMKGLIGRLQIPVLKLAMLDHGFLANRAHPARVFINTLARAASGVGEMDMEAPLFLQAGDLVHRIQEEFTDDPQLFATCLQALEAFLAEQERLADEQAARLAAELERAEREEIGRGRAAEVVAEILADSSLPAALHEFIAGCWQPVLAAAAARQDEGRGWDEACATLQQLVWSVRPKRGAGERQRLIDELPGLLRGLRGGLDGIGVAEAEREAFFATLVALHAAAVKAGMSAPTAPPLEVELPPLQELLPVPPPALPEEDEALPPEGITLPAPAAMPSPLERLARGCWLDLYEDDGSRRHVRLTWISPARTMYLFAQRQGEEALAITRSELETRFARGMADFADEEPLIDRIVVDLLAGYSGTAG